MSLKVQVILFYYNRPKMASKFSLESVCRSNYDNWELALIDDSHTQNGPEVLDQFFDERPHYQCHKNKMKIYQTDASLEEKMAHGGESMFGKFANDSIWESNADITIQLCDDDAVLSEYLYELNEFYTLNPHIMYSYCHVIEYNPLAIDNLDDIDMSQISSPLNSHRDDVHGHNVLDCSQVSWRREDMTKAGTMFPYPQTKSLDATIYASMSSNWGMAVWNGTIGQYKGVHEDQLGHKHGGDMFNPRGIEGSQL